MSKSYNTLGKVASQRRWTLSAKDCYQRGCVCDGCGINTFFQPRNYKCRMKATVLELVRVLGAPKDSPVIGIVEEKD